MAVFGQFNPYRGDGLCGIKHMPYTHFDVLFHYEALQFLVHLICDDTDADMIVRDAVESDGVIDSVEKQPGTVDENIVLLFTRRSVSSISCRFLPSK